MVPLIPSRDTCRGFVRNKKPAIPGIQGPKKGLFMAISKKPQVKYLAVDLLVKFKHELDMRFTHFL